MRDIERNREKQREKEKEKGRLCDQFQKIFLKGAS